METTRTGVPGSTRWKRTAGIACMATSAIMLLGTSFVSPGANADEAQRGQIVVRTLNEDGLGKRDSFSEADLLVQDEVQWADGTFSDGDPAAFITPPIDPNLVNVTYVKRYDVKELGIPTFREGSNANFRIRVYPRLLVTQNGGLTPIGSKVSVISTTDRGESPGTACDVAEPVAVPAEGSLEYVCTITNIRSKGVGTAEDLVHTINVTRTGDDGSIATGTDAAAVNVVVPCVSISKQVRQAGTGSSFVEADTPQASAIIAGGATAEYRTVVNNCGEMDLVNVVVTDTIAGCNKTIGALGIGQEASFETGNQADCVSVNVTAPGCSTATVVAQPVLGGAPAGGTITMMNDACISGPTVIPTTAVPTTAEPTTAVPTTAVPTTAVPTTAVPTTAVPTTIATPCIKIKTFVRTFGSSEAWNDADTPEGAAIIALGGTAEYQFVVTNCGNVPLTNVTVTTGIPACDKIIGDLAVGQTVTYGTAQAGNGCTTTNVTTPSCLTGAVVGTAPNGAKPTSTDPACIKPAPPAATTPTVVTVVLPPPTPAPTVVTVAPTVSPTTAAPTTVAATTTVPAPTTAPAPPTTARVEVLPTDIANSTETEDLSITGSSTTPMLYLAAALMLMGVVLLGSSRTPSHARRSR